MNESNERKVAYHVKVKGMDSFVFGVRYDINRTGTPDAVLQDYIHENYGNREYEYQEIENYFN
ncbi:hypothetical protein [Bacillus pumilus]|uniref:hypothetical protein n=1 Tax=Bacillus pumilus TaxID=1408 RepID=UPI002FFAF533